TAAGGRVVAVVHDLQERARGCAWREGNGSRRVLGVAYGRGTNLPAAGRGDERHARIAGETAGGLPGVGENDRHVATAGDVTGSPQTHGQAARRAHGRGAGGTGCVPSQRRRGRGS